MARGVALPTLTRCRTSQGSLKFRLACAEAAGVAYREYMLELLDTGRHLQADDVAKRRRKP